MIDLSAYSGEANLNYWTPKTPQQKHDGCTWCASKVSTSCECLYDCGRPCCGMSVEEFVPPSIPRFKELPR